MIQLFFLCQKRMVIFFTILFFIGLFSPVLSQSENSFELSTSSIELKPGGSTEIQVDVYIPKNQHLYVKKASALSFNNPTTFVSLTKGIDIVIQEEPSSEKKGEDYILAGQGSSKAGTYTLTIYETLGKISSAKPTDATIAINTQFCNSQTDQCLNPKTITKKIKVFIKGEKEVSMVMTKSRASGGVQWIQSLSDAKSKAASSKQNIFVIITAPTWCGYCKVLERDVFAKDKVINTLNTKFVPLQVLDTSSDLNKFSFKGFPTMFMLDSNGKQLSEVNGRNETSFLASIQRFEVSGTEDTPSNVESSPQSFQYAIKVTGKFAKNANGTWTHTEGSTVSNYKEYSRDENYIILQKEGENQFYAFPQRGKKAYYLKNNKWELLELE
jgi:thioredoxin-related protein